MDDLKLALSFDMANISSCVLFLVLPGSVETYSEVTFCILLSTHSCFQQYENYKINKAT